MTFLFLLRGDTGEKRKKLTKEADGRAEWGGGPQEGREERSRVEGEGSGDEQSDRRRGRGRLTISLPFLISRPSSSRTHFTPLAMDGGTCARKPGEERLVLNGRGTERDGRREGGRRSRGDRESY